MCVYKDIITSSSQEAIINHFTYLSNATQLPIDSSRLVYFTDNVKDLNEIVVNPPISDTTKNEE